MRAIDSRIVCCGIISSCQPTATSQIVKVLLAKSSSHVKSAEANTEVSKHLLQKNSANAKRNVQQWCMFESPVKQNQSAESAR